MMTLSGARCNGDAVAEIGTVGNATCKDIAAFRALPNRFFGNG